MIYLERNKIIIAHQHDFLSKHSTSTQLLECLNDRALAIDLYNCTDACYIDFAHAFDSVSIPKHIKKLIVYGINGQYLL